MKKWFKKHNNLLMLLTVIIVTSLLMESMLCAGEPIDVGGAHCSTEICSCVCHNPDIKQVSVITIKYQPTEACAIDISSKIKGSQCNQEIFIPPRV